MLKSIQIDGLKSLCDFKMDLQPGLNVLVGPNGSGKTNILTAFALLSELIQKNPFVNSTGLENAELFDVRRKDRKIKIAVKGTTDGKISGFEPDQGNFEEKVDIRYRYECEIVLQPEKSNEFLFSRQFLEIETDTSVEGDEKKRMCLEFANNELKLAEINNDFINSELPTNDYESYFIFKSHLLQYNSLIGVFNQEIIPMESIMEDIVTENFLKINPYYIRDRMEQPTSHSISSTGFGLLSTLLDIFDRYNSNENELMSNGLSYSDVYKKIMGYFKLLIPELEDLEVYHNSERNEIESYAIFNRRDGKKDKIPLRSMSDGTLMWLSIVTALLTSKKIFLLEEPENYLHPALQNEFVSLVRLMMEHVQNVALVSTHSESVLNSLNTSEVIVTDFQNECTQARRIANPEQLNTMLQESDFGLGWYYISGSLDIEPETQ